jgi:hypothetical protein
VDILEPLPEWPEGNEFRHACVQLLAVLQCVDTWMSSTQTGPPLRWLQASIALGLRSTAGMSTTEIAQQLGITKQALSRGTVEFLRMVRLPPAFGLKSEEARKHYQECH